MNIRFTNATVMPMVNGVETFAGEVWVKGDRIDYVGPAKEAEYKFDEEIDANGNIIMPGFKDAHTHSAMTFLRSYVDDLALFDWLNKEVFPMEAKLKPEDMRSLVKLAIMEYLTSGITACFDMYMYPDETVDAMIDAGFRIVLCGAINDFGGTVEQLEKDYVRFNQIDPLVSYQLGFHAEYTTSRELLEQIATLADKYSAPVYTHNSEGVPEVEQCIERTGMTPTAYMDSLGLYKHGGGGYHCVYLTDEDMDIFVKNKMFVVTNPGSNTKLASGIAPLTDMVAKDITVAIGTDGPASNNALDMFREMFLATGLQKLRNDDASAMNANDVLRMATVGGAQAMHLEDCDVLAKGKYADLIMIDLHQPNMQPINNLSKNIVYSGSKQNVILTMINGKILYRDGKFFINDNPEDIYKQANEVIRRLSVEK